MLLRLAYLGITSTFALLRLLPGSDRDKDAEILALRHQLAVLQRQLGEQRVRFDPADRARLAALLHQLLKPSLRHLPLLVRPDTVLRWHRDVIWCAQGWRLALRDAGGCHWSVRRRTRRDLPDAPAGSGLP